MGLYGKRVCRLTGAVCTTSGNRRPNPSISTGRSGAEDVGLPGRAAARPTSRTARGPRTSESTRQPPLRPTFSAQPHGQRRDTRAHAADPDTHGQRRAGRGFPTSATNPPPRPTQPKPLRREAPTADCTGACLTATLLSSRRRVRVVLRRDEELQPGGAGAGDDVARPVAAVGVDRVRVQVAAVPARAPAPHPVGREPTLGRLALRAGVQLRAPPDQPRKPSGPNSPMSSALPVLRS
jgi:hypothetical protein